MQATTEVDFSKGIWNTEWHVPDACMKFYNASQVLNDDTAIWNVRPREYYMGYRISTIAVFL